MNFLENISFKHKLFIPLVFTISVLVSFLWQNYKLSNFLEEKLLLINKHEIWLNTVIQSISMDINSLKVHFINRALQNKVDSITKREMELSFKKINQNIKNIKDSTFLHSKKVEASLYNLSNRLQGYYSILLSLPEAYQDSPEDTIYTIVSLGSVHTKIESDLHTIIVFSKEQLNKKIDSIYKVIDNDKKTNLHIAITSMALLIIFNLFVINQFLGSIRILKEANKTFYDFLHGHISKIKEITHLPNDEIGDILQFINKNSKQAHKIITKERELLLEVNQLNNTLEQRVENALVEITSLNNTLEQRIQNALVEITSLNKEIEDTQKEVIFTMGAIGESRSKETGNHVKRVAEYSKLLAKLYGLNEREANLIKEASPMHDIGKVAIPDNILNKPGKLTNEEFTIMQTHAKIGYEMLKHSNRPILKTAAIIAYQHHEKYNGKGYPNGLKGDEIHIYGQITAIADVFDALGSDRVYKKAWPLKKILKLFEEEKGEHFNPKLTELFLANIDTFLEIRDRFTDVEETKEVQMA